ncbi:MAG: hypothetical protein ACK5LM_04355 [Lactovum sp.]
MFKVDYKNISDIVEKLSDVNEEVRESVAKLLASEAKRLNEKFDTEMELYTLEEKAEVYPWLSKVFEERDLNFEDQVPVLVGDYKVKEITNLKFFGKKDHGEARFVWVVFKTGLDINVTYNLTNKKRRAVGFKLAEGVTEPKIFEEKKLKFYKMKDKVAGVIRGSYFVIKKEY